MVNNQNAEQQGLKDNNNVGESAQSVREAFSNQAMSEAVKSSQMNSVGKEIGQAAAAGAMGAAAGGAGKELLPNIAIHASEAGGKLGDLGGIMSPERSKELSKEWQERESQKGVKELLQNQQLNKLDNVAKQVRDGSLKVEDYHSSLIDFLRPKDGVQKLSTGDYLVKEDGKQTVFTPNGDRVTVNPDGTNVIKGDVSKVSTNKDGETTVEFRDGGTVCFDKDGIRSVSRDGKTESFANPWEKTIPIEPNPHPWPHPFPPIDPEPFPHPFPPIEPFPHPHPWPIDPIIHEKPWILDEHTKAQPLYLNDKIHMIQDR